MPRRTASGNRASARLRAVVDELVAAARELGIAVRLERGSFRGGACRVEDEPCIVLNRLHPPEAHLAVLAQALREQPMDEVYLRPATRAALEDAWAARPAVPEAPDAEPDA